jgi:hypothetical protein
VKACGICLFNNDGKDVHGDNDDDSGDDNMDDMDDMDRGADKHDSGHNNDTAALPYCVLLALNLIGAWVSPFH